MIWLSTTLRAHPELALFLALALGHAIGRLRIGPFRLNVMVGVLLSGVVIGQIGITVPGAMKWGFFLLFLFTVGYQNGPQFFRSIGRSALPQVGLTVLLCGTALATSVVVARGFGFDAGMAAGLVAGSMTESAAVGTAADALAKLPLDESARAALSANVTVAFAVTYLVGLLTVIVTLAQLGPKLMGVDLAAECRKLEEEIGVDREQKGVFSAYWTFVARAYRVSQQFEGKTASDLERVFEPARVFVERVRSAAGVRDADPHTVLHAGDLVVLIGRGEALIDAANPLRSGEVHDAALLDVAAIAADAVLTRRDLAGRTLADVGAIVENEVEIRGVFVRSIKRGGEELPHGTGLKLERGDVLRLVGAQRHVERVAARLGFVEWPSDATDLLTIAAAITIGGLVGVPVLRVAGFDLGLSVPVGVLLGGLVAGWLRSVRPVFGRVPEPALWVLDSLGLTAFLALVGISAGPGFAEGIRHSGLELLLAGLLVCAVPHVTTILVGRYVLRMHPGVVLGVCAGAGTAPAALAAVQEAAGSRIPALGYGVSYAVGNVLLALWGSIVVMLMAG